MGRNRLTIEQFKIKNLPFVDGLFSITELAQTVTITRSEVSTGKRGRKPFVYHIQGGTYTGTVEPGMTLSKAMAEPAALVDPGAGARGAGDGGVHE